MLGLRHDTPADWARVAVDYLDARLDELLDIEAEVACGLPLRPELH